MGLAQMIDRMMHVTCARYTRLQDRLLKFDIICNILERNQYVPTGFATEVAS